MAAPFPGISGPAPGGGGYLNPGGGRNIGGGTYSIPAQLRVQPGRSPRPLQPQFPQTIDYGHHFWNPYGSVEGFENYHHPLLKWGRGDVFPGGRPDLTGFPSVPRVQEIADAQNALRGQGMFAPRAMGRGLMSQNPDILQLLRERLGMGAI